MYGILSQSLLLWNMNNPFGAIVHLKKQYDLLKLKKLWAVIYNARNMYGILPQSLLWGDMSNPFGSIVRLKKQYALFNVM